MKCTKVDGLKVQSPSAQCSEMAAMGHMGHFKKARYMNIGHNEVTDDDLMKAHDWKKVMGHEGKPDVKVGLVIPTGTVHAGPASMGGPAVKNVDWKVFVKSPEAIKVLKSALGK